MKCFCDYCLKETEFDFKTVREEFDVKNETISIESTVKYCKECGEYLFDTEIDSENMKKAFDEYKRNHDLMSSEEIKKTREKYGLSAAAFSKILGFGEKTITRYENGAIQDNAQNTLLYLMQNPNIFKEVWYKNKNLLSEYEIAKTEKIIASMLVETIEESSKYDTRSKTYYCKIPYVYYSCLGECIS